MKLDQKGFSGVTVVAITALVLAIGLTGWLVLRANDSPSSDTQTSDLPVIPPQSYDASKGDTIADFNKAPEPLKAALVNDFYDQAKTDCEASKKKTTIYMTVKNVVREDFALIGYCDGPDRILANVSDSWRRVATVDKEHPLCEEVDRFKISKGLFSQCLLDDDKLRDVTYP